MLTIQKLLSIASDRITFVVLLLLLLLSKLIALYSFGFEYTGSDDMIFWQAATDYAKGVFHEPYFYGQNYNFLLESLFAVPLLKVGVPHYIALPISTTILGVFPFIFIAAVLYKNGFSVNAFFFLVIPICLPVEYDLLTGVTRGFISGIFFCSFLVFCLLKPFDRTSFFILGVFVSIGYIMNANSLIFSFPLCLYLLLNNYRKISFYLVTLIAATPALLIQYFAKQFYVENPSYLVHKMWELHFSFDQFWDAFRHLDQYFSYLTPVFWKGNWVIVLIILILGILAFKNNWKKGVSVFLSALLIFFLTGVNKVNDDIGSVFLSSVRMFLAIPLLTGLCVFLFRREFKGLAIIRVLILCVGVTMLLAKVSAYPLVIEKHTKVRKLGPIAIKKLDKLREQCEQIEDWVVKNDADIIVYVFDWRYAVPELEFYNYGCPILSEEEKLHSMMNICDRRTWVFEKESKISRERVLIFNHYKIDLGDLQTKMKIKVVNNDPSILLIEENDKTIKQLAELMNFDYKRNSY